MTRRRYYWILWCSACLFSTPQIGALHISDVALDRFYFVFDSCLVLDALTSLEAHFGDTFRTSHKAATTYTVPPSTEHTQVYWIWFGKRTRLAQSNYIHLNFSCVECRETCALLSCLVHINWIPKRKHESSKRFHGMQYVEGANTKDVLKRKEEKLNNSEKKAFSGTIVGRRAWPTFWIPVPHRIYSTAHETRHTFPSNRVTSVSSYQQKEAQFHSHPNVSSVLSNKLAEWKEGVSVKTTQFQSLNRVDIASKESQQKEQRRRVLL